MLISTDALQRKGNFDSYHPSISSDGRYVAFSPNATDLAPGDCDIKTDVFHKDLQTGELVLVSTGISGKGDGDSINPHIDGNGRFVAFQPKATDLVG